MLLIFDKNITKIEVYFDSAGINCYNTTSKCSDQDQMYRSGHRSGEFRLENNYAYIAIFAIIGVVFAVVTMWFSWVLRPTYRPAGAKAESYECGEIPIGSAWTQFRVGYYIFALVFVIFDVEAIFIFPWAKELLHLKQLNLGVFAFVEMMVFIAILLLGLIYAWR
jgi:NADH-quinone oxidoreductase subunit A